jgi:hypothetical protein
MGGMEKLRHSQSRRSFAGAANGEIAQADYRQPGLPRWRPHAQPRRRAVERCQRRQRRAASGSPPKSRLTHQIVHPDTMPVMLTPQAEAG